MALSLSVKRSEDLVGVLPPGAARRCHPIGSEFDLGVLATVLVPTATTLPG
ncbi:hypothetical protein [Polyangium sp. 6x1]|uniref:hypothetical protein n=1 Tax=Polyangium sp. 6x1 TaxID=3042689 RepID=UPI002482E67A|nr:hypothetical protein [Polyangium sp. 6x1]MDI1446749.1 hypothetical protein [Polyangium sp. 6x1]